MLLARISGSKSWTDLYGKVVHNKRIDIQGCGDIHPHHNGPIFPHAENLYVRGCDKNFVYYWLQTRTFPNVKMIYLSSHPCEPQVLHRFPKMTNIYLDSFYSPFKTNWAARNNNVMVFNATAWLEERLRGECDEELIITDRSQNQKLEEWE